MGWMTRYAEAYGVPEEAVRDWFDSLEPDVQAVAHETYVRGYEPLPREAGDFVTRYRAYQTATDAFNKMIEKETANARA